MIKKKNLDSSLVNYIDNLGMGVEARGAIGGTVYYVEGNSGKDAYDGLSIDYAFKTLAKAIAVSNIDINRRARWARRNTIYLAADTTTEDLVAFPNKCDIVGIGSYDANTKPGIIGNHVPVNAGNYGTRFINVWFKGPASAHELVTLASTSSGIQFVNCTFSAHSSTTIGILATASPFLKVIGCRFEGAFATSYMTFGTGEAGGTEIKDSVMMDSAAAGIVVGSGMTSSWGSLIKDNTLYAATITINDDADLFFVTDNVLISALAATTTTGWGSIIDINVLRAARNHLVGSDVNTVYPIVDSTT
jgi:hypothetical protein